LRRIQPEKALEIVRMRLRGETVPSICEALGLPRSTVYKYLDINGEVADKEFIDELELAKYGAVYDDGKEGFVQLSEQARRMACLLRRYSFLPESLLAKAILNAHWRRVRAWKRRKG